MMEKRTRGDAPPEPTEEAPLHTKRTRAEAPTLPELKPGQRVLLGKKVVRLVDSGRRDQFDARLFHLEYERRREMDAAGKEWHMPGITGNGEFSRDDLQNLGATFISRQRGA